MRRPPPRGRPRFRRRGARRARPRGCRRARRGAPGTGRGVDQPGAELPRDRRRRRPRGAARDPPWPTSTTAPGPAAASPTSRRAEPDAAAAWLSDPDARPARRRDAARARRPRRGLARRAGGARRPGASPSRTPPWCAPPSSTRWARGWRRSGASTSRRSTAPSSTAAAGAGRWRASAAAPAPERRESVAGGARDRQLSALAARDHSRSARHDVLRGRGEHQADRGPQRGLDGDRGLAEVPQRLGGNVAGTSSRRAGRPRADHDDGGVPAIGEQRGDRRRERAGASVRRSRTAAIAASTEIAIITRYSDGAPPDGVGSPTAGGVAGYFANGTR